MASFWFKKLKVSNLSTATYKKKITNFFIQLSLFFLPLRMLSRHEQFWCCMIEAGCLSHSRQNINQIDNQTAIYGRVLLSPMIAAWMSLNLRIAHSAATPNREFKCKTSQIVNTKKAPTLGANAENRRRFSNIRD